jgi:hypothetical protein
VSTSSYLLNLGAFGFLLVFEPVSPLLASVVCAAAGAALLVAGSVFLNAAELRSGWLIGGVLGLCGCIGAFGLLAAGGSSLLLAQAAAGLVGGGVFRAVIQATPGTS